MFILSVRAPWVKAGLAQASGCPPFDVHIPRAAVLILPAFSLRNSALEAAALLRSPLSMNEAAAYCIRDIGFPFIHEVHG